ncbi:MAG: 1-acyl-sn-glycerol-3-phosphate acyltransferase [Rhodothermales bacterium]|jgi:1-acyl-sn-glycerol-3-phosphate acyltransferase
MLWRFRAARFSLSLVWETMKLAFLVQFKPEKDRRLFRAHRQRKSCKRFCRILKANIIVVGDEPKSGAMIVMTNHLGLMDPWVLGAALPVAFAAKVEMAKWPVMGWVTRTVGVIFVERDRRLATSRFVEELRDVLRAGVRGLVFPEGTVGDGRTIRDFKTGGFAAVAGMEDGAVLPVYHNAVRMNGKPTTLETRELLGWPVDMPMLESARRWLSLDSMDIEVRIGEPIPTAGRDRKELAKMSRAAVRALAGDLVEGA